MTFYDPAREIQYNYTQQGYYSFPFKIFHKDDIKVTFLKTDEEVSVALVRGFDYEVEFDPEIDGGRVLMSYANTNGVITISRVLPCTQETDYVNNDPLNVEQVEEDFDKVYMLMHQCDSLVRVELQEILKNIEDLVGGVSASEINAANCAAESMESAVVSGEFSTESHHWANHPEDVPVPEGSGTEFSAYHWKQKAQGIVGGGITSLTGVNPIVVTGGANDKTISFNNGGTFNVKTHGAIGDGVTDDTAAIRATVTAAEVDGGVVYFPIGKYVVTGSIVIEESSVVLKGCVEGLNKGSVILLDTSIAGPIIQFHNPGKNLEANGIADLGFTTLSGTRDVNCEAAVQVGAPGSTFYCDNFSMSNLSFNMIVGNAVSICGMVNSKVINLYIQNSGDTGHPALELAGIVAGSTFIDVYLRNNYIESYLFIGADVVSNVFTNMIFDSPSTVGQQGVTYLTCDGMSNIFISCVFAQIVSSAVTKVVINGDFNEFSACFWTGAKVSTAVSERDILVSSTAKDTKITGCIFVGENSMGRSVRTDGYHTTIINCSFRETGGIVVYGQRIIITNCSFTNYSYDNQIELHETARNTIIANNNMFTNKDSVKCHIKVDRVTGAAQYVLIKSNIISGVADITHEVGILFEGSHGVIEGNIIKNTGKHGIQIDDGDPESIVNNSFMGCGHSVQVEDYYGIFFTGLLVHAVGGACSNNFFNSNSNPNYKKDIHVITLNSRSLYRNWFFAYNTLSADKMIDAGSAGAYNADGNMIIGQKGGTPNYVLTNNVDDRRLNTNATTLAELADVVATIIKDLNSAGITRLV